MSTTPSQIGVYTIDRELGRGGMGVVYLGHDTRLDRDVAIKALPEHLAEDPDRLARFEREAKTLASLSHPNVAGIHGVEEHDGARYLVLEYVEGETLAERLDRGALPVDEALDLASQVAAGMEAAHDAGVIHRDLKPGNIIVTPEGKAVVLDFGLARTEEGSSSTGMSMNPTLTSPAAQPTVEGVILGTAAYMSPEQARGRRVDKRTDIWSFGVVLYEMLTGASPFIGETVTDSIGAILHKDIDLERLPAGTPPAVRHALRRCLQRDKQLRYRDIGDVRLDLQMREPDGAAAPERDASGGRGIAMVVAAIVVVLAAVGGWAIGSAVQTPTEPDGPLHLAVPTEVTMRAAGIADRIMAVDHVSRRVVLIARDAGGPPSIYVRALDESEPRRIPGTERATDVTVSPDGQTILFCWSDPASTTEELRRVSIDGGPVTTLLSTESGPGFSLDDAPIWLSPTSVLVRGGGRLHLYSLSLESLETTLLVDVGESIEGAAFAGPWELLPDGQTLLSSSGVPDPTRGPVMDMFAINLDSGEAHRVVTDAWHGRLFDDGRRIAFIRNDIFCVARFDASTATVVGEVVPLYSSVRAFSISPEGDLYFQQDYDGEVEFRPVRVDMRGERTPLTDRRLVIGPAISVSPDGESIGITTRTNVGAAPAAEILNIATDILTPVVKRPLVSVAPQWLSPERIVYLDYRAASRIEVQTIDIGREARGTPIVPLGANGGVQANPAFSPDGRWMVYRLSQTQDSPMRSLWIAPLDGDGEPRLLVNSGGADDGAAFSPDGRWLAYNSDSAGADRILMQRFDTVAGTVATRIVPVSPGPGMNPIWSPDGAFLYYFEPDVREIVRVAFGESTGATVSPPEVVLAASQLEDLVITNPGAFALFPDGESFAFVENLSEDTPDQTYINVTLNWLTELQERMPLE